MDKHAYRLLQVLIVIFLFGCTPSKDFIQTSVAETKISKPQMITTDTPLPTRTFAPTQYSLPTETPVNPEYSSSTPEPFILTYTATLATKVFFENAKSLSYDEFIHKSFNSNTLVSLPCQVVELKNQNELVCSWPDTDDMFFCRTLENLGNLSQNNQIIVFGYINGTAFIGVDLLEIPSVEVVYFNSVESMLTATAVQATNEITQYATEPSVTEFITFPDRMVGLLMKVPCQVVDVNEVDFIRMLCTWPIYDELFFVSMAKPYSEIKENDLLTIYGVGCGWACFNNSDNKEDCVPCVGWAYYEKQK